MRVVQFGALSKSVPPLPMSIDPVSSVRYQDAGSGASLPRGQHGIEIQRKGGATDRTEKAFAISDVEHPQLLRACRATALLQSFYAGVNERERLFGPAAA